ncbi:MAG: AMP-binding protein, partial [Frankia sp.]
MGDGGTPGTGSVAPPASAVPEWPGWLPSDDRRRNAAVTRYAEWLGMERGLAIGSVGELWRWSTSAPDAFWESIWDFCAVTGERGDGPPLAVVNGADGRPAGPPRWFPDATVNYARNALARRGRRPAVIAVAADATTTVVSWDELASQVAIAARALLARGIRPGDTVCGVMPSAAPAVVAMLAAATVGAVWSSVPPDLTPGAIAER